MKQLNQKDLLIHYYQKYELNKLFSNDMLPYMTLYEFDPFEHICKDSSSFHTLFFFVKGKAKVYSSLSNGKSLLLCFYRPFKVLGEVEFIYPQAVSSNVQALERCLCIGISMDIMKNICMNDSLFLTFLSHSLAEKLNRISVNSSINLLYQLENRLASYITLTYESCVIQGKSCCVFQENLSHLSDLLGTSYRHLLRTLKKFCDLGLLEKKGQSFLILDMEELCRYASDIYLA